MKTFYLCLTIFIFNTLPGNIQAQSVEWANKGGGVLHDPKIAVDANGNTYVSCNFLDTTYLGVGNSFISAGDSDFYLCKYDSVGLLKWAVQVGSVLGILQLIFAQILQVMFISLVSIMGLLISGNNINRIWHS
ncbi:MAG: hypothetical protein IPN13_11785 [Bacteroidetes bacterium]|nr:hypothetical protein [Bacteroidota bacterium]